VSALSPVPVNVIAGALGVGKTTAIAKLLAAKPSDEYWVVILNEFTDAGIDALTLASAARGAYDVRVIPGGCLCCTGELDFRRQLRELLKERRPARILIEPSGIGHPGSVIEELRGQERTGALRLCSMIGLVDPQRLSVLESLAVDESVERDQLECADVLVLTKADMATPEDRQKFFACAQRMYPPKRWLGVGVESVLRAEALDPPTAMYTFETPQQPAAHAHASAALVTQRAIRFGSTEVIARVHSLLARHACGWTVPRDLVFNRVKLHQALLHGADGLLADVERFKAVLRTGVEHWTLLNVSAAGIHADACGWRQDSRIEVQMKSGASVEWRRWDDFFVDALAT